MKKTLRLPVMVEGYLGAYSFGFATVVDDFDAFCHCWKTMWEWLWCNTHKNGQNHRTHELDMWQAQFDEKEKKSWKQSVGQKEHA